MTDRLDKVIDELREFVPRVAQRWRKFSIGTFRTLRHLRVVDCTSVDWDFRDGKGEETLADIKPEEFEQWNWHWISEAL
jgi:hypothetical protein